jgi:hypothetical protein
MVMTQPPAVVTEARRASAAEIEQIEREAMVSLGRFAAEMSEITYGVASPGLDQAFPKTGPPHPLILGKRYLAGAAGPATAGSAEFVLEASSPAF